MPLIGFLMTWMDSIGSSSRESAPYRELRQQYRDQVLEKVLDSSKKYRDKAVDEILAGSAAKNRFLVVTKFADTLTESNPHATSAAKEWQDRFDSITAQIKHSTSPNTRGKVFNHYLDDWQKERGGSIGATHRGQVLDYFRLKELLEVILRLTFERAVFPSADDFRLNEAMNDFRVAIQHDDNKLPIIEKLRKIHDTIVAMPMTDTIKEAQAIAIAEAWLDQHPEIIDKLHNHETAPADLNPTMPKDDIFRSMAMNFLVARIMEKPEERMREWGDNDYEKDMATNMVKIYIEDALKLEHSRSRPMHSR